MKTAKDYLEEANAVVTRLSAEEAVAKFNAGGGTFIDVRDGTSIAASGTIKGAHRIPRGMLEFTADPAVEALFNPIFADKSTPLYLICGAGGQAALAGKTLADMGFTNAVNIGGFADWSKASGPTES